MTRVYQKNCLTKKRLLYYINIWEIFYNVFFKFVFSTKITISENCAKTVRYTLRILYIPPIKMQIW